jgi:hypothetical protein
MNILFLMEKALSSDMLKGLEEWTPDYLSDRAIKYTCNKLFFGGIGIWTQGLAFSKQVFHHLS